MARVEVQAPTELMAELSRLESDIGTIKQDMLDAGAEVAKKAIRRSLETVKSTVRDTRQEEAGTLEKSMDVLKGKDDRLITFLGTRKRKGKTVRNNEIAAYLEYGVAERGQVPRPYVRPAMNESEKAIAEAMESTFNKEAKKDV